VNVVELHGRQSQQKRMAIYFHFKEKKQVILFTTNIAARGLDFPGVKWVIQNDVPENVETYVHRVGRTARFVSSGKALTFIDQHEHQFLDKLDKMDIYIQKVIIYIDMW
jgi:ATP-dependent RNA helicase DDX10/DBP4